MIEGFKNGEEQSGWLLAAIAYAHGVGGNIAGVPSPYMVGNDAARFADCIITEMRARELDAPQEEP